MGDNIIRFKRDTAFRKQLMTADSFSHPAKLDSQLLIWLVEKYTKPGEAILDPMAGSGTLMLACMLGRNCILVELESKFVSMAKANWEKVRQRPQLGYEMGTCKIIQGDARHLEGLLVDKCVFSPPFGGAEASDARKTYNDTHRNLARYGSFSTEHYNKSNIANLPYGNIDQIITSPPYAGSLQSEASDKRIERICKGVGNGSIIGRESVRVAKQGFNPHTNLALDQNYSDNPSNIGNLPYGNIDQIITSPPYEGILDGKGEGPLVTSKSNTSYKPMPSGYCDSIITSPPYEGSISSADKEDGKYRAERLRKIGREDIALRIENPDDRWGKSIDTKYSENQDNIGNLKGQNYLSEMLKIYKSCYLVLKPGGLLILILKNFIREQKVIRLDLDTIKLCEQSGFTFIERWYRKLPAQSFWRILYKKKFPMVETIDYEDVLIFRKR